MSQGIYIHIPFCLSKCHYCDFNSSTYPLELLPSYCVAVKKEVTSIYDFLERKWPEGISALEVDSIYFGGGTPSLVSSKLIGSILELIKKCFPVVEEPEITLEVNPDQGTYNDIGDWKDLGINRISIGVQSFNQSLLNVLGRRHKTGDSYRLIDLVRVVGISNIGLDLIFGVPGQSVGDLKKDLDQTIDQHPTHVSAYNLSLEKEVPLARKIADGELKLPSDKIQVQMIETCRRELKKAGYQQYEISNFALPGYQSIQNSHYWAFDSYLGFGCGAHSFFRYPAKYRDAKEKKVIGARWANEKDLRDYLERVEGDSSFEPKTEELTIHQAKSEFLLTGLRRLSGVKHKDYRETFGTWLLEDFGPEVGELCRKGLLESSSERIYLTDKGLLFADEVCREFC